MVETYRHIDMYVYVSIHIAHEIIFKKGAENHQIPINIIYLLDVWLSLMHRFT